MANDFLQGLVAGSEAYGGGLQIALQRQQLKSQDAERQVRERLLAEQAQKIEFARQKDEQDSKELGAAAQQAALASAPFIDVPPPVGQEGPSNRIPNPNPMSMTDALGKFVVPIALKQNPQHAAQILQAHAAMGLKEAQASWNQARPDIEQAKIDAGIQKSTDSLQSKFDLQKNNFQQQFDILNQKHEDAKALLDLHSIQQTKLQEMKDAARLAIAQGEVSREQWMNRHLNTYINDIRATKAGAKLPLADVQTQVMDLLGTAWDTQIGSRRQSSPGQSALSAPKRTRKFNPATGKLE